MMRVNHVRLRSITQSQTFGADMQFRDGLNVIRADNTSGKSTCLLAILYGLGMERCLGPRLAVPLPYSMRERIQVDRDSGEYEEVVQAYVMLEIGNGHGDVMALRRDIEGGSERKLVRTWPGSTIAEHGLGREQRDFFLHDAGAAVRESGFHSFLAEFIGWELPVVLRYDGGECPLYMETLWPLFFVEQKRGWSEIQGPFPTFFRIQDVARRVAEFVLKLDVAEARRRRAELAKEIGAIERRWSNRRSEIMGAAGGRVRVSGIPQSPTAEFAKEAALEVSVHFEEQWVPIETAVSLVSTRREALEEAEPKAAEESQEEVVARLRMQEEKYAALAAQNTMVRHEYQMILTETASVRKRLESLRTDLLRNQDAQKLKNLGSEMEGMGVDGVCPTCHQVVEHELLPEPGVAAMGIEENIAFIRSQMDLFGAMEVRNEELGSGLRTRYQSVEREIGEARAAIRALKDDLLRASSSPTRSGIEEMVRAEARLEGWLTIEEEIDGVVDEMKDMAGEWVRAKAEYRRKGGTELSGADRQKIGRLESETRELLSLFGFMSFREEGEIGIAADDYRPYLVGEGAYGERVEKSIGFEASASDGIRLKWAYYLALIKISEEFETNHLGVVVFDEPGQQQMKDLDLSKFLDWTAREIGDGRQVIVSTSEDLRRVAGTLGAAGANIQEYEGFMLAPIGKNGRG